MIEFVSYIIDREIGNGEDDGRTFNCGIIFIDEMALYQLDRQAGLSDSTTAHNNELVFSQKLCTDG